MSAMERKPKVIPSANLVERIVAGDGDANVKREHVADAPDARKSHFSDSWLSFGSGCHGLD
jgi:hypothetical protein